jgi:hypothetical protein
MSFSSIIAHLHALPKHLTQSFKPPHPPKQPDLHTAWQNFAQLPAFVRHCPITQRLLALLGPLPWDGFPERELTRKYGGHATVPLTAYLATTLIKIEEGHRSWFQALRFLREHPALLFTLGFPLTFDAATPWGFDPLTSLPTERHFTRMLRTMDNAFPTFLFNHSVRLLQNKLAEYPLAEPFGTAISLDTKLILAWVKENNRKAYVKERYAKEKQPMGDRDCKLGVKRRRNQKLSKADDAPPLATPPVPGGTVQVSELYWGYDSGVVATKIPDYGEFVLAEYTQPFNRGETTYFHPLMAQTEQNLGFRPRFGAFDAAFDAWYVYEHFHFADGQPGFAAVPRVKRSAPMTFDHEGRPHCAAGLAMPVKGQVWSKVTYVPHERTRFACPLLYPHATGETCPVDHRRWPKGGCLTTIPSSVGSRLRHTLDRESEVYQEVYRQRTATERINSQAKALGIETPKLRNQAAIMNQNTLIYTLINLRAYQRLCRR